MNKVLRSRDFRFLWLGQTVSTVGDRMIVVALALFVTERTGNAADVGLVLAAYTLPLVLFLPLGGVWADRIPRRGLMIGADVVRFAMQGGLALSIALGTPSVVLVMVFEAVCAIAEAFFRPAYTGLLPQTVPDDLIQQATSLSSLSQTAAGFFGPALATALVAAAKAEVVFAVDAASFVVSAAFLLATKPRQRGRKSLRPGVLHELREGYEAVRSRPWIWVTLAVFSVAASIGFAPYFVLGPTIAEQRYQDSAVFGVLVTTLGVGWFLGALIGLRWRPRRPLKAAFVAVGIWPVTFGSFALGAPVGILVFAMACTGAAMSLFEIWWNTTLVEQIPPEVLSRVSALDWLASVGLFPLGYLAAGFLASDVGASALLIAGAAIAAVLLAVGLIPKDTRALTGRPRSPAEVPRTVA
jgi:predicted MFS family arabinose efflux permease